jgi:DNA recombination protein RmuC
MLLGIVICIQILTVALILVFRHNSSTENKLKSLADAITKIEIKSDHFETVLREGIRDLRAEVDKISARIEAFGSDAKDREIQLRDSLAKEFASLQMEILKKLQDSQDKQAQLGTQMRDSIETGLTRLGSELRQNTNQFTSEVRESLQRVAANILQLSESNAEKQDQMRVLVDQNLGKLNENNVAKLEEMRQTVDEKLHTTLQARLTESFGLVVNQLGTVQKGLGEMKSLAAGVGDLQRVLTNVKSRGGFAEVQLGMQLEQMLAPSQYRKNVQIKPNSQEKVEFAICLPHEESGDLLLPIDAKFPREDWERLEEAHNTGDLDKISEAQKALEATIKAEAKKISDKYIIPPITTNFAVMYLPTEGLFGEAIRRIGLIDELQTKYRVCVAGPTTFMALLTSLQMGFKTLAIQNKSVEVWNVLAAAKVEFQNFGKLMNKVENQVHTVQNTLEEIGKKTKTINRKLGTVDAMGMKSPVASVLLEIDAATDDLGDPVEQGFPEGA